MEQQIPFSEPNTGSKKTLFIILGAVVAVVIIAFVATNGGGLMGSFVGGTAASGLKVSVTDATFLKSGDLALTYSMENTGDTVTNKDFYILFKGFVNRVKVPTFVKPWNDQGLTELRKGEKITYNTVVPQSMFPSETYGATDDSSGLPPSISPIKTVEVKLFGFNSQGSEAELATSKEVLPTIEK